MTAMNPLSHVIFSLPVAALVYIVVGAWEGVAFYLAAVFIDFDHYMAYVATKGNLDPSRAYEFFLQRRKKYRRGDVKKRRFVFLLFHNYEAMIAIGILGLFYTPVLIIWLGFVFHLLLDLAYNPFDKQHRVQVLKNWSLIYRKLKHGTIVGEVEMGK